MLTQAGLPKRYWAEAVATASYLRNRTPTSSAQCDLIPCELWDDKTADLTSLKVFGCIAYAHIPDANQKKLDQNAVKLRFVGYDNHKSISLDG